MTYGKLSNSIKECQTCSFYNHKYIPIVPPDVKGNPKLMIIGDSPSWDQNEVTPIDSQTESGQFLERYYLSNLGIERKEVWITDFIKCRYPKCAINNYDKYADLIEKNALKCAEKWLLKEIEYIQPNVIATLGDKNVYQRFNKLFKLSLPTDFKKVVGRKHIVKIRGQDFLLFPLEAISIFSSDCINTDLEEEKNHLLQEYLPRLKDLLK